MREICCCRCGAKTMNIEKGSSIKKGTVTICVDCIEPGDVLIKEKKDNQFNNFGDLLNLFGMKL